VQVSVRYVTGTWEPWALTVLVVIILVVLWRLLNLAADLIAYGLERTGPGAPMLDTAHGVGPWKRGGGSGDGAPAMPEDGEREGAGR